VPRGRPGNRKNPDSTGLTAGFGNSVYPAVSRNDNHSRQSGLAPGRGNGNRADRGRPASRLVLAGPRPWTARACFGRFSKSGAPGPATAAERGRRRTRQDQISWRALSPVKLRTRDPHRTKKTGFFCRTGFRKSELFERTIQPFDLMSRRHPLSSTRAAGLETASRSGVSWRLV
jgi:hypothetical protein